MRKLLMLFVCSLPLGGLCAQSRSTIRVKAEEGPQANLSNKDKYLYEQFKPGTVHYRNGQTPTARLNYNLLLREMQFVSLRGDTLTLDQEHTIRQVSLQGDTFVFDSKNGFLKIVGDTQPVRLAVAQSLQVAGVDKQGGYGKSSGVSSIKAISTFSDNNSSISRLNMKGDVVYSLKKMCFFLDQNEQAFPATKKNLFKLFPKKQELDAYLQENHIQFDNPADLQKLLAYCQSLM